ncbi:MAG: hypothetical protein JWP32_151 [Schumannella sp.]|nr:hypothetical protein [Schumannella sp.]
MANDILNVIDWRNRTFALYAEVRAIADPAEAHAHWRSVRDDMFAHHPATAILPEQRAAFTGLRVSPYDPSWRFEVPIRDAAPASFEYETGTDGLVRFDRAGTVDIPDLGTLDVWRHEGYGGGVFLPIKDGLAGKPGGTYGGGRYLLDTIKGSDLGNDPEAGTLVLDFNFAYNPSCAYDPAWACPLAPAGDRVAAEIPVGERA